MPDFGVSSLANLAQANPDLQRLFREVVKAWDCTILPGTRRTVEQEAELVAEHKSTTMHSMHLPGPDGLSRAVDVAPFPQRWDDGAKAELTQWEADQVYFAGFVLGVASQLGISIRYGGDWNGDHAQVATGFRDLDHFELHEG